MTTRDDLALAHRLADAAGEAIRPFFRARYDLEIKADKSPVTEADRAAEAAIRAILEQERPGDGIIGEEYGSVRTDSERVWILDPIDGTKGLITGRQYIVGLALVADGAPVVAAMGNPARSAVEPCVMVAAKGHGLRYWPKSGPGPLPLDRAPDFPEEESSAWYYTQTDPNQHVNSLAYLHVMQEFAARRLHHEGASLAELWASRARLVFRKPCFRGEEYNFRRRKRFSVVVSWSTSFHGRKRPTEKSFSVVVRQQAERLVVQSASDFVLRGRRKQGRRKRA